MTYSEVLSFLPLLIYGIAIAELLSQWKRFINVQRLFLPYTLVAIILTELALYNVFLFAELVEDLTLISYYHYLKYILPPFIFMLTVNIFTPNKKADTREYFIENMPIFFTLLAIFISTHFLFEFNENSVVNVGRIIAVGLAFLTGITRKIWMVYLFFLYWVIIMIVKGLVALH
jgi:hypothetical protein